MTMRAWHGRDELRHLARAEWIDGLGEVADSCSLEWYGEPHPTPEEPMSSYLRLSPDDGATMYGPYDALAAGRAGEERRQRVSGRLGHHFEAEISERSDEGDLYEAIVSGVGAYAALAPWQGWIGRSDRRRYMTTAVSAELFRAQTLGATRQILARWGLTIIPTATLSAGRVVHGIELAPLYPLATGDIVRLEAAGVSAYPSLEFPDLANPPGRYLTRRIVGMHRRLGVITDDPVLVTSGAVGPATYLEPSGDLIAMRLGVHVERWRQQNSALKATIVLWGPRRIMARMRPQRLLAAPAEAMGLDSDTVWAVESVRHRWDADRGYRQEIQATYWQGTPVTVAVRESPTPG